MKLYYVITGYSASNKAAYKTALLHSDLSSATSEANDLTKAILEFCRVNREPLPEDLTIIRSIELSENELIPIEQINGATAYAYKR